MAAEQPPSFASLLSRFRVALGLTQEEVAERAGLSARAISDLERGVKTRPRAYTVRQLAGALRLSAADRAVFEQAALAAGSGPQVDYERSVGGFLGAVPASPLVAREEERERLRAVLEGVAGGAGQLLLLSGEAGVGKTRLAQEVMVEARGRGYLVATGRCYAAERATPYYPFLEALGGLASAVPASSRSEVQRHWTRVKHLANGSPAGDDTPAGGTVGQQQVSGAVGDLLLAVQAMPLALLLDDLQWADPPSLRLLQHLAHAVRGARILLAGTFRDTRLSEEHPDLARLLQDLMRERVAERLGVRRFSAEETTALVAATMGQREVSEEFAAFVHRRTKGNPRLVDQLVRSLGGRLELQGEIGAGAMGRVFRARDRATGELVAAKLVLARAEIPLDALLRFQQEGAVLAALSHPNIVRIHDTFAEEHASCIVMELLDGPSLGQLLRDGPLPLPRAKTLALQVAAALAHAHTQGIVHRDIKPDNVMVVGEDRVKVTDFGIARLLRPDTSLQTIATTGLRLGTPLYMAPEQIEGKKVDGRTDIYAFGALLFHMVTGRPPFEGGDALAVAIKHLQDEPQPPSALDPAVPTDWDALIGKALEKDPARRFQSAKELEQAVAVLGEVAGTPARESAPAREKAVGRARRWPAPKWMAAAAGLLSLVGAVAVVWLYAMTTARPASLSASIDAYLRGLAAKGQFSGTALVARQGNIVLEHGYGLVDRAQGIPNTPATRYPVGGVSESLSVLGVLQLIERGVLSWQTPICARLPQCPPSWRPITVGAVLDGTADLPDYEWGRAGNTTQQSIAGCQSMPLSGLFGRRGSTISYWSCAALVLGTILEWPLGHPWDNLARVNIFGPAGMQHSERLTDAAAAHDIAQGYAGTMLDSNTVYDDSFEIGATAHDVYAYDNALFGGRLLSRQYLTRLFTPRAALDLTDQRIAAPGIGYLWRTGTAFGHQVVYTIGRAKSDFFAANMYFPEAGATVVILSNNATDDVEDIAMHAAALVFGTRLAAQPAIQMQAPAALVGTYRRTFQDADRAAAHDPGLKDWVGGSLTINIGKDAIHFALITDLPENSSDEYYTATEDGLITLGNYTPENHNSACSDNPHQNPPATTYRWARQGNLLTISRIAFDPCLDRGATMPGKWTKIG
jgi:serine/threonine-protein kinase